MTRFSDFINEWNREAMLTQKVFDDLTANSLSQKVFNQAYYSS